MALTVRKNPKLVQAALLKGHNLTVASSTFIGSSIHGSPMELTTGGWPGPFKTTAQTITTPNATDLASANTLLLACVSYFLMHLKDSIADDDGAGGAHKIIDTVSVTTLTALLSASPAMSLASTTLAAATSGTNSVKSAFNLHTNTSGVHFNSDAANNIATADASDLASLLTLVNAEKTALNSHTARGPGANVVMVKTSNF